MGRVLWVGGSNVEKGGEGSFDVPGHGDVNEAAFIVPCQGEATIKRPAPIDVYSVQLLECFKEGRRRIWRRILYRSRRRRGWSIRCG